MSILVIDIGNTSTSLARYGNRVVGRPVRLKTHGAGEKQIVECARRAMGRSIARAAMIASVVPPVDRSWRDTLRAAFGLDAHFVSSRLKLPLPLCYPKPETIGADRIANAVGGAERYGVPLIVADFGTAVTFDIVTDRGYEGGIIAPGWPLVFDYLAEKTAKLPRVRFRRRRGYWGRTTEEAICLGAQWGYPGLARGILARLRESPALRDAKLIITGGHGKFVADSIAEEGIVDPSLTLFGIGRIFDFNFGES